MNLNEHKRWKQPISVHKVIDEFGLSLSEFRVYAHLARRANRNREAWPRIRSLARYCRINKDTAVKTIAALNAMNMIITKTDARGTVYQLTDPETWRCTDLGDKNEPDVVRIQDHLVRKEGIPLYKEKYNHEVIPIGSKTTCEQLIEFAQSRGRTADDGSFFYYRLKSRGWKSGKSPIVDVFAHFCEWEAAGWLPSQKQQDRQAESMSIGKRYGVG